MSERKLDLEELELRADRALFAVDPGLARELGYEPPLAVAQESMEQALGRLGVNTSAQQRWAMAQQMMNGPSPYDPAGLLNVASQNPYYAAYRQQQRATQRDSVVATLGGLFGSRLM